VKTYTITGPRAQEAIRSLRNMDENDFDALFRVIEDQPNFVKFEVVADPNSTFVGSINGIVGGLVNVFGVTMTEDK
jgi:hypothetical protein